jgi:hypothetical protein
MIEVKNIVNREITHIPKEEHWIQMQIQMETCDLNECDFIETRFREFDTEDDFYAKEDEDKFRGVYLCFLPRFREEPEATQLRTSLRLKLLQDQVDTEPIVRDGSLETGKFSVTSEDQGSEDLTSNDIKVISIQNNEPDPPKWVYMPIKMPCNKHSVESWINQKKLEIKDTHVLYCTRYWYLDEFSCILVKRNRLWFQSALPFIRDTWEIIEKERKSGYEHRAAKKRSGSTGETTPDVVLGC